jgi:hypothetical protein
VVEGLLSAFNDKELTYEIIFDAYSLDPAYRVPLDGYPINNVNAGHQDTSI